MGMLWEKIFSFFSGWGVDATDSDEERLKKNILVMSYIIAVLAAFFFVTIYIISGELLSGALLSIGALGGSIFFVDLLRTRDVSRFQFAIFFIYLVIPSTVTWSIGGFNYSGLIIIWAFLSPILALITSTLKNASRWFVAYLSFLVISGFIQPFLPNAALLSENLIIAMLIINLGLTTTIIFMVLKYFIDQKNKAYALLAIEQEKSDYLLLNILPAKIAELLKEKEQVIAENVEASVLFADIVGFTPLSAKMEPKAMIELLNEIYSHFDGLVERYGAEKIRTIGDNYMVVAGVPTPSENHAKDLALMALDMQAYAKKFPVQNGDYALQFRIGINTGSMVAGVIGKKKFQYDVWGDTVNVASRMESHGAPEKIHVTDEVYAILKDEFKFEKREKIEVKGKGEMQTWFLTAPFATD